MFKCANSGQNEVTMNEKENKLTPTYIREKNFVSRQFTCTYSKNITVFVKNGACIVKLFFMVKTRKSFVSVYEKMNLSYFGMIRGKNSMVKNENCIFPES